MLVRRMALGTVASLALLIAVAPVASATHYPPKEPTCTVSKSVVQKGSHITVSGDRWGDDFVTITFIQGSKSKLLDKSGVDHNEFSEGVEIPHWAKPGSATIRVDGRKHKTPLTCSTDLTIVSPHNSSATLASTGVPMSVVLVIVLAIGIAGFEWNRRRRALRRS